MNEQSREHLSALLDGEADELNLRRLLQQADDASKLRQSWQRYHLISDMLHERPSGSGMQLADRVRAQLDDEDAVQQPERVSQWWKPFSHLAVAASVAAVVFVGVGQFLPRSASLPAASDSVSSQVASVASTPALDPSAGSEPVLPVSYSSQSLAQPQPGLQPSHYIRLDTGLDDYLQRHNQRISDTMTPWQLGWAPDGYQLKSQDLSGDQQVMTYANDTHSFSVFIEPLGLKPRIEGAIERQGKVVLARQLLSNSGDCYVTVAGDIPQQVALAIIQNLKHASKQ